MQPTNQPTTGDSMTPIRIMDQLKCEARFECDRVGLVFVPRFHLRSIDNHHIFTHGWKQRTSHAFRTQQLVPRAMSRARIILTMYLTHKHRPCTVVGPSLYRHGWHRTLYAGITFVEKSKTKRITSATRLYVRLPSIFVVYYQACNMSWFTHKSPGCPRVHRVGRKMGKVDVTEKGMTHSIFTSPRTSWFFFCAFVGCCFGVREISLFGRKAGKACYCCSGRWEGDARHGGNWCWGGFEVSDMRFGWGCRLAPIVHANCYCFLFWLLNAWYDMRCTFNCNESLHSNSEHFILNYDYKYFTDIAVLHRNAMRSNLYKFFFNPLN